ncbi:MAG: SMI1/KNR4 family protein [Planctomycetota bacterium]
MTIEMTKPQAPVEQQALASLEKLLGAPIPDDYKRFVMLQNGGWSHDYRMTYQDSHFTTPQTLSIYRWLPVGRLRKQTGIPGVEEVLDHMSDVVPPMMFPFAADDSGDPILLALSPLENGSVYFLNSQAPPTKSMSRLADSFTDFINGLTLERRRS